MYSRVLVPLDGSERAERALAVAGPIARASHGMIILLRVVTDLADTSALVTSAPLPRADYLDRDEREARAYLQEVASSESLRDLRVETRVEIGATAEVILDCVSAWKPDSIVLCSHGRTGFTRWALGSVAQQIVRRAPVPIVLLRERGGLPLDLSSTDERPFRMLIPLDGSEVAESAVVPAITYGSLVAPRGFEAHLVRVLPFVRKPDHDTLRDQAAHEANAYLERTARKIASIPGADYVRVTTAVVYERDVAAALAHVAEGDTGVVGTAVVDGCDMIAMATHGRTGLALLAMGSVTDRTLTATNLPALVVRPGAVKRQDLVVSTQAEESAADEPPADAPHPFEALF